MFRPNCLRQLHLSVAVIRNGGYNAHHKNWRGDVFFFPQIVVISDIIYAYGELPKPMMYRLSRAHLLKGFSRGQKQDFTSPTPHYLVPQVSGGNVVSVGNF